MNDLATFTQQLKEKHIGELTRKFAAMEKDANVKKEESIAALNDKFVKEQKQIDDTIAQTQQIESQKIRNHARNQVLVEKQQVMLQIFDEAVNHLSQLPTEQMAQFFNSIVKQLPQDKQYVLTCGEKTPLHWELPEHVTLSDETLPQQSGFVFSADGISYNFLFQTLVDDLKQTYLSELLQSLQQ
ncbi:hypothetical protein J7S27_02590 [Carnobacteriaceae bacterium zg-C25]|nr:hypothetical protein J7S27_02590 [Carnobacteriaceae bacterium zg-C25]